MNAEPVLSIVGLGPGGLDKISTKALAALKSARRVLVRTEHHPAVAEFGDCGISFESFDHLYETVETFEELYHEIAERVLVEAPAGGVVYATPGHPLVGEKAVALIIERARELSVRVRLEPSPSFIEATLEALEVSLDKGLKILDALQIEELSPSLDTPSLIYQVYDEEIASRVKLRLMDFFPDEWQVTVVRGAGTDEQEILTVPLYKLDWQNCDHLTSVFISEPPQER